MVDLTTRGNSGIGNPNAGANQTAFNNAEELRQMFEDSHRKADTDVGDQALHHTLGTGPFQAARGSSLKGVSDIVTQLQGLLSDFGIWQAWNPTFLNATRSPVTSKYTLFGDLVIARFSVGIVTVSGTMALDFSSLPFPIASYPLNFPHGIAYANNPGVGRASGFIMEGAFADTAVPGSAGYWKVGTPFAWSGDETLNGMMIYERA